MGVPGRKQTDCLGRLLYIDVYRFSKNGILEPNNIIPVERIPLNHPALSDVRCFHFSFSVAARWKSGSLFQLNVIVKTVCF